MPMTHYVYVYALECHYGGPVLFGVFLQKENQMDETLQFFMEKSATLNFLKL